jgi:hypothetical protein
VFQLRSKFLGQTQGNILKTNAKYDIEVLYFKNSSLCSGFDPTFDWPLERDRHATH